MSDSIVPAVIAGLAAGVVLVLTFAALPNFSLDSSIVESYSTHFENKPQFDHKEVPNLALATQDGKLFLGEEGSYCLTPYLPSNFSMMCADSIRIAPQYTVTLQQASKVQFRTFDKVTLNGVDSWVTNNQGENSIALTGLGRNMFSLDLPKGDYNLIVQANWADNNGKGDAYYYYRIHVV